MASTEYFNGSDCSGSSGDSNRVLTLSNSELTQQEGVFVYLGGLALTLTEEYTATHNSASTTITFLNPLWDDQLIIVRYIELGEVSEEGTDDFTNGPLKDFGVNVTRTPVTTTTDFHGQKTYTDGSDSTIVVVFSNANQDFALDKSGLTEVVDAQMFTKEDETINKYDKITHDSKIYRVDKISLRKFAGTSMFRKVNLFLIE